MEKNKLSIQMASLNDIPVIQSIANVAFPDTYKDIITPEQCSYMMDMMYSTTNLTKQMTEQHHTYLIAFLGDKAVGYVSVQPLDPSELEEADKGKDVFELQKIYVLPDLQQHHIGRFLFDHAVGFIRELHPEPCLMELHVNRYNKALGFYQHMGMTKLREGDYPIGKGFYMNDYIMGMEIR